MNVAKTSGQEQMNLSLPLFDRLQDCWDPVSEGQIDALEARLAYKYPGDYRQFLLRFNAGSWRHGVRCRVLEPSRLVDEVILTTSLGFIADERFESEDIWHNIEVFSERIPGGCVPIMDASSDLVCLDLRSDTYGQVFYWNRCHEDSDLNLAYLIADSFAEFLVSLRPYTELEDRDEELPAFQAVERGDRQAVLDYLFDGGRPDIRNAKGWTLLMCAARNSWPRIVDILLRSGADADARDAEGWCPLHHAVWGLSLDSVKHLLAVEADANYRDAEGRNLAQIAQHLSYDRIYYHLAPYMPYP